VKSGWKFDGTKPDKKAMIFFISMLDGHCLLYFFVFTLTESCVLKEGG